MPNLGSQPCLVPLEGGVMVPRMFLALLPEACEVGCWRALQRLVGVLLADDSEGSGM